VFEIFSRQAFRVQTLHSAGLRGVISPDHLIITGNAAAISRELYSTPFSPEATILSLSLTIRKFQIGIWDGPQFFFCF
jgi:hypothetical protein